LRNGDVCLDLLQKPFPNGVSPGPVSFVSDSTKSEVFVNPNRHAISFTFNRTNSVVVEYLPDPNIDLFQIGRYKSPIIDFHIGDVPSATETKPTNGGSPFLCKRRGKFPLGALDKSSSSPKKPMGAPPTVSRFACRIDIDRRSPHKARIYAAGFDTRNNIFLGVEDEDNVLEDGTLIDLCGAILIWRSAEGLKHGLILTDIDEMVNILNQLHIQCPVYLKTLHFNRLGAPRIPFKHSYPVISGQDLSRSHIRTTFGGGSQPHVYLNCGHVHGYHDWQPNNQQSSSEPNNRTCPLCRQKSQFVRISIGEEVGFFVDRGAPSHCFNPCGHIASEATVRFWSKLRLPVTSQTPMVPKCPFCAHVIEGPPVRLIFQHRADENTLKEAFEALNCTPLDSPHRATPFVFAPATSSTTPTVPPLVDSDID
uniref:Gelsolin-like domain-containing protein n=1 Tax=Taenia asiatica TaxID=60517 RepID=A0A158R6U6_TAEAS